MPMMSYIYNWIPDRVLKDEFRNLMTAACDWLFDHARDPFRFECDMLNPLIESLPVVFRLGSGQSLRVLQEATIGSVDPDILVGIGSAGLPRWSISIPCRAVCSHGCLHERSHLRNEEGLPTSDAPLSLQGKQPCPRFG